MDAWKYQHGARLEFIRPGRSVDNGYIEWFNGRLRDTWTPSLTWLT
jgi:putative transposase